jgi:hypothetical protein
MKYAFRNYLPFLVIVFSAACTSTSPQKSTIVTPIAPYEQLIDPRPKPQASRLSLPGSQATVNVGTSANDGTGDPLRSAFQKVNANFTELYATNATKLDITNGTSSGLTLAGATTNSVATASRVAIFDSIKVLTNSAVTTTELGYVSGVTSALQTQIDAKQATITGGATTITSSDLTASRALIANGSGKVAVSSTVSDTELGYLDGVTSALQTQLDAKQATITGGATTITSSDLTASRALIANGSGKVAVSSTVSDTELGYLDGVSSALQTQIDAKLATTSGTASGLTLSGTTVNSGTISSTGQIKIQDGSAADPSIEFISDDDGSGTGFYRSAANEISVAINGVQRRKSTTTGEFVKQGTSTVFTGLGGTATSIYTAVNNAAAAGDQDLMTYTLPANSLANDGDRVVITAWGVTAGNVNTKDIKVHFGSDVTYQTGATIFNSVVWKITTVIIRSGATSQVACTLWSAGGTLLTDVSSNTLSQTCSGAIIIKLTGASGASAGSDITQRGMTVEWYPASQ